MRGPIKKVRQFKAKWPEKKKSWSLAWVYPLRCGFYLVIILYSFAGNALSITLLRKQSQSVSLVSSSFYLIQCSDKNLSYRKIVMKFFFLSNFPLNWLTKPNSRSFNKKRSFHIIRCFFTDLGALKPRPTIPCNILWGLYAYLMSGWMEIDQIWHAASFIEGQIQYKNSDQSIQPFFD